ncbi:TPA: ead/Ea22-like family protein [Klebsiella variicola subsp. variicola]|nr:ead/Ea22-like family protein [Klebsiella variicola subsp. variicola]
MTDITELTSVQKNANIHRLSRLIAYASNDELRQMAVEVEHYTDQLIEALEKAQTERDEFRNRLKLERSILEDADKRIAELESRTVKLSPELYTIGDLIRTQDNRITDQPMFVVFQKREIIGSDEHSPSRICWVWDGEEVSELRAKRLEALYQDGRDTRGYDRYAMQEVDEFVTACFTEHGCKDYLRQNGHNLRLPYIYACGSFRNNEYQLVRNWLAGIKVEAE